MGAGKRRPTDAELEILGVLWERGPSTVREVAEATGRAGAYTTVLKLLQIMTEKAAKLIVQALAATRTSPEELAEIRNLLAKRGR